MTGQSTSKTIAVQHLKEHFILLDVRTVRYTAFIILILNHIKDLGRQPDSKFCAKSKHMMPIVKP